MALRKRKVLSKASLSLNLLRASWITGSFSLIISSLNSPNQLDGIYQDNSIVPYFWYPIKLSWDCAIPKTNLWSFGRFSRKEIKQFITERVLGNKLVLKEDIKSQGNKGRNYPFTLINKRKGGAAKLHKWLVHVYRTY